MLSLLLSIALWTTDPDPYGAPSGIDVPGEWVVVYAGDDYVWGIDRSSIMERDGLFHAWLIESSAARRYWDDPSRTYDYILMAMAFDCETPAVRDDGAYYFRIDDPDPVHVETSPGEMDPYTDTASDPLVRAVIRAACPDAGFPDRSAPDLRAFLREAPFRQR